MSANAVVQLNLYSNSSVSSEVSLTISKFMEEPAMFTERSKLFFELGVCTCTQAVNRKF